MSSLGSISLWIARLRDGNPDAAQALWERFYVGLVAAVKRQLWAIPRGMADEEDVALSAFDSFFRRASQGQFPRLADRHDLWDVLMRVASCKAHDLVKHEQRQKRDWRKIEQGDADAAPIDHVPTRELEPALAAEVGESLRRLLAVLEDDELRTIAQRKLEGYTNDEIAEQIGRALPTVERRLARIRATWKAEITPDENLTEQSSES